MFHTSPVEVSSAFFFILLQLAMLPQLSTTLERLEKSSSGEVSAIPCAREAILLSCIQSRQQIKWAWLVINRLITKLSY